MQIPRTKIKIKNINQILPDTFYEDVKLKEGICLKIEKKKTKEIIDLLKQFNLNKDKVYLKQDNLKENSSNIKLSYSYGKNRNTNQIYEEYDISFLKRVKPIDKDFNHVLINFTDHLDYLDSQNVSDLEYKLIHKIKEKLILSKIFDNITELDENITTVNIPYKQPLTEYQLMISKKHWHLSNLPTSATKISYTHNPEEFEEIENIIEYLINPSNNIEALLYDPTKKFIKESTGIKDKVYCNPISHSIMQLIEKYSNKLLKYQIKKEINHIDSCNLSNKLLGNKIEKTHLDEYLDNLNVDPPCDFEYDQYYCENMHIFTKNEPCFMCAMALVHSRVARIYYINENKIDGAMASKFKINNCNLNHSYLIFNLEIE